MLRHILALLIPFLADIRTNISARAAVSPPSKRTFGPHTQVLRCARGPSCGRLHSECRVLATGLPTLVHCRAQYSSPLDIILTSLASSVTAIHRPPDMPVLGLTPRIRSLRMYGSYAHMQPGNPHHSEAIDASYLHRCKGDSPGCREECRCYASPRRNPRRVHDASATLCGRSKGPVLA